MEICSFDGYVLSPFGWVREWPTEKKDNGKQEDESNEKG